jgi:hypothetical protein
MMTMSVRLYNGDDIIEKWEVFSEKEATKVAIANKNIPGNFCFLDRGKERPIIKFFQNGQWVSF